jgi:L-seryl-tRNA(Ser) seleniumtransferase
VPIKPPDLLNRLPSVSELLDKPPVRALTDRWNRSVVAGGVRSFLDELKNDLRRRTADVHLPTIRELAERAARYIVSQQHQQLGTAINATGRIWGKPWVSLPLSDTALERAVAVGREFVVEPVATASQDAQIESALCQLTGAQSAIVVHNYAGALWLALATLAGGREVLVARAEVGDIGPAVPLPNLIASANARLCEVGTTNRALAADYESAVSPSTAALLKISPDEYQVVGQTSAANLEQLVGFTRERELVLIAALGTAPLVNPKPPMEWPQPSAVTALAAGIPLVTIRGDGIGGGPPCGILLGDRELIARISQHPLFPAWRLDAFRSAALAATLECHLDAERGVENLPAWQLLATPIENLRNRAERIAPQLAHASDVATAVVVETRSPISAALTPGAGPISCGVAITARSGAIAELNNRLRALPLPVVGRVENDRLVLDLRTVLPRQDRALVEAIVGSSQDGSSLGSDIQHADASIPKD